MILTATPSLISPNRIRFSAKADGNTATLLRVVARRPRDGRCGPSSRGCAGFLQGGGGGTGNGVRLPPLLRRGWRSDPFSFRHARAVELSSAFHGPPRRRFLHREGRLQHRGWKCPTLPVGTRNGRLMGAHAGTARRMFCVQADRSRTPASGLSCRLGEGGLVYAGDRLTYRSSPSSRMRWSTPPGGYPPEESRPPPPPGGGGGGGWWVAGEQLPAHCCPIRPDASRVPFLQWAGRLPNDAADAFLAILTKTGGM